MKRNMQILGFCMLFVILLLSGCSLMPANTGVLIGTNLALSGKGMSYSTSTERGIELAKDMVNDRGGLLGKPVQLVSVDNHGKPEDAVAAIQQLTVRHVSAIIGPDLADCTRAVIPNVEAVKIPLISPACTQPDITVDAQSHEVYRYIFRAAYIDASQGRGHGRLCAETAPCQAGGSLLLSGQDVCPGPGRIFPQCLCCQRR